MKNTGTPFEIDHPLPLICCSQSPNKTSDESTSSESAAGARRSGAVAESIPYRDETLVNSALDSSH